MNDTCPDHERLSPNVWGSVALGISACPHCVAAARSIALNGTRVSNPGWEVYQYWNHSPNHDEEEAPPSFVEGFVFCDVCGDDDGGSLYECMHHEEIDICMQCVQRLLSQ